MGKNSFHLVGQDRRDPIVLRQKWTRGAEPDELGRQSQEGVADVTPAGLFSH